MDLLKLNVAAWFIFTSLLILTFVKTVHAEDSVDLKVSLYSYRKPCSQNATVAENEFREQDIFANEFISKNGADYILLNGTAVSFKCESTHPVRWKLPSLKEHISTDKFHVSDSTNRISDFSISQSEPSNLLFESVIAMFGSANGSLIVNMTCATTDGSYSSSIFLFKSGTKQIEGQGGTIYVNPPQEDTTTLVLPCRPTNPTLKLVLEKQHSNSNGEIEWKSLISDSLTFDPRIGFTVTKEQTNGDFIGLYKCSPENNPNADKAAEMFAYVNVTTSPVPVENEKFESRNITRAGGSARLLSHKIGDFSYNTFECCTGDETRRPLVMMEYCGTVPSCEISKDTVKFYQNLLSSKNGSNYITINNSSTPGCSTVRLMLGSITVSCQDENVDYSEQLVEPMLAANTPSDNQYQPFDKIPSLRVDQKMSISLVGSLSNRHYRYLHAYNANLVQAAVIKNRRGSLTQLVNYEDEVYPTENVVVMCRGMKLLYANGTWIRLNWKNGTKTILTPINTTAVTGRGIRILSKRDMGHSNAVSAYSTYAKLFNVSADMESIDCYMPVWDTPAWDVLSYNLNVSQPHPPRFAERETAEVNFRLHETNKEIVFEIRDYAPIPQVKLKTCTKAFQKANRNTTAGIMFHIPGITFQGNGTGYQGSDEIKHKMTAKITFSMVTKEMECEYQVAAANMAGTASQKVKVTVSDK